MRKHLCSLLRSMKSHPWYSIALIVLGAYALLSIAYQVFDWHLLGARRFQAQWLPEISIPNSSDNLTLKVRSPDRLAFDKPGMPGSQISIQLRAMQPVTRPLTYTVSVEPITGEVTFADKDGVLISPRADLVAGVAAQESATWFLRWTPRDLWHSDTMTLTLRVFDSKDEALYSPLVSREIPIALESPYSVSVLVRILDMLLGSNAPQIGVAGLLVVLFFGLLKTQKDERQKRRQRRLSDEIIALDAHWSNNTRAAVDRYIYCNYSG